MPKRRVNWDEPQSVAVNARTVLPVLLADYFAEVRGFLARHREPAELHCMRLASKRLRYTLELFRPCYGPGLEQRLHALKKLQDALGDVNDATATLALLGDKAEKKVRDYLRKRADEKAADFRKHWKEDFDAPDREKWWTRYLEKTAREPKLDAKVARSVKAKGRRAGRAVMHAKA